MGKKTVGQGESPTVRAYRELLGVAADVGEEELKKAYHRLALLYHPDRNPGVDTARDFQKVREAYAALSDLTLIRSLNQAHAKERLFRNVVDGLEIPFGAFFGYRIFAPAEALVKRELRIGAEVESEKDTPAESFGSALETDNSILDSPGHDALEIVYAGKFSVGDDERLKEQMDSSHLRRLPWVVLNNQGLIHFLEGDLKSARKCYEELNARIPKNIIFMYRLGLCHILEGFADSRRSLLGFKKPNMREINQGVLLFRHCISLGQSRSVGKMRCLLIRKLLADVLEKVGSKRRARKVWREILQVAPSSIEATIRLKGWASAAKLIAKRQALRGTARPNARTGAKQIGSRR